MAFLPLMVVMLMMALLSLMMVAAAARLTVVVVMVFLLLPVAVRHQLCHHFRLQIPGPFYGSQDLLPVQLLPGGGDNGGLLVMLPDQRNSLIELFLRDLSRTAEHDGSRMGNLIDKKLSEILNVHPALGRVHNGHRTV